MDVVILAGGRCDDALREATGAEYRADIKIGGRTLAAIVLGAVRPLGGPVLVGGPEGIAARRVPAGENFCGSLANGLAEVKSKSFLLVTVDLPCLTTAGLQDFVANCDTGAGLNYPIVRIEDCERAFPGMKRTTLKLREGTFTGGNVALMDTEAMKLTLPVMERAYAMRKKPLKLAQIVGVGVLFRVMFGQLFPETLSLEFLEKGLGRFLGVTVHGVVSPFAELGADLDKAEQFVQFARLKRT